MHNTDHTLDLFITKIQKEGLIEKAMFSIYVDDKKQRLSYALDPYKLSDLGNISPPKNIGSKLLLGGYDLEKYAVGPIAFHDVDPLKIWWTTTLGMLSFVGTKNS